MNLQLITKLFVSSLFFVLQIELFCQVEYLPESPGKWKPWEIMNHEEGLTKIGWTKKEQNSFSSILKNLSEKIKLADVFPKGVDRRISGGIKVGYPAYTKERNPYLFSPVSGYLLVNAFGHYRNNNTGKVVVSTEGPGFDIYLNWLAAVFPEEGKLMSAPPITIWGKRLGNNFDEGEGIFYEPQQTGKFQGFPIYGKFAIVITKNLKPLWAPVSRERFLKAIIKEAEFHLKESKENIKRVEAENEERYQEIKKYDPAKAEEIKKILDEGRQWSEKQRSEADTKTRELAKKDWKALTLIPEERVRMLKEELESLSPEERISQAYFIDGLKNSNSLSGLVPKDSREAHPLVTLNPDFFDPALPKSAIQLIVIWKSMKNKHANFAEAKQIELVRSIDWNKIMDEFVKP